jgi:alpha-beta hydrolase superfamily lysophospholipase
MALIEIDFPSNNGRDMIHAWVYQPTVQARAVVHLIHGLGEHSRRYLHLIVRLLDEGFVVVADDHAGHGRTAMATGIWADAGEDADRVVVADEQELRTRVRQLHPDLPYIVFGHSWGSMIARGMAAESSGEIDALVLGGIAAQLHGIEHVLDRDALAAAPEAEAPVDDALVQQTFDGFVSRYGPDAGPTDWVARNADVVRDHATDPFNNFGAPMSVRFLRGFVALYDAVNSAAWYDSVRTDLPVLILAGSEDPVANFGEGAYHVANTLVATGHPDVRTRVWAGFRHEVHNEPEIRDEVEGEIVSFVERVIGD